MMVETMVINSNMQSFICNEWICGTRLHTFDQTLVILLLKMFLRGLGHFFPGTSANHFFILPHEAVILTFVDIQTL